MENTKLRISAYKNSVYDFIGSCHAIDEQGKEVMDRVYNSIKYAHNEIPYNLHCGELRMSLVLMNTYFKLGFSGKDIMDYVKLWENKLGEMFA